MKNEVKIDPITIIGESNKKLPNVNTALGRKQAKFYRDRILNGEMSFDAVPKNYRGTVQNYLKSVPIENMFNINLDIHANTTKHRGKGEYLFSLGNRYGGFINNINNRRKYNFGGIRSTHDATADYLTLLRE